MVPLSRITINNFKSIKACDISFSDLNILIGENGAGKTNLLDAINYFYDNLTSDASSNNVFDENNPYSNEVRTVIEYDLTEFVKIAKSNTTEPVADIEEPIEGKSKYTGYYKAIITMASKFSKNTIRLELSQIKGKSVRWSLPYANRAILKGLFPILSVNARSIDVAEWTYIWETLGELGKVSNEEREQIHDNVSRILESESKEISGKIKSISGIFDRANVKITPAASKEFATALLKVYYSGESIQQGGRRPSYYSTGTSSVKYIELLLMAIDEMSKTKLKEPIILLDEPELNLHTYYLDELASAILNTNAKLSIVISTHSPRLTKDIIVGSSSVSLYNVRLMNKQTQVVRMRKFLQYSPTSRYRVTDEHINSYFSRAILFVEGESELELFSNPYILLLFPKLKYLDVFKALSDKPILNIMNPRLNRMQTPYLCLIDMDKAIQYNPRTNTFEANSEYIKDNPKEKYQYRNKNYTGPFLYHQYKRIHSMIEGLRIYRYDPYYSCNDPNYTELISAIHCYLLAYNVFSFTTTIEGALINRWTKEFALSFLSRNKGASYSAFKEYWDELMPTDQINVLRLVFNGKSDLLQRKQVYRQLSPEISGLLNHTEPGKKASGWMSDYIDSFFSTITGLGQALSIKVFKKHLEDPNQKSEVLKNFRNSFPELNELIMLLNNMIDS